jgi:protoporphyrinogen IX oxidase
LSVAAWASLKENAAMGDWYAWTKALHVIAIISWMAGLLYLPRLFVYHCAAEKGCIQSETFKTMERKLYRFIMTPAMVVAWTTGSVLAISAGFYANAWFILKLALVVALTGSHLFLGGLAQDFAADRNQRTDRFFRILNEIPTLLMVAIVCLVIVKPF